MMSAPIAISSSEMEQLARYVEDRCGIVLPPTKRYLVEARIGPLLREARCATFGEFFERYARRDDPRMRDRIIDAVTTNETLWFRDGAPWCMLRDTVLPSVVAPETGRAPGVVRIWSAACATGQEPYSIAMLVDFLASTRPRLGLNPDVVQILATDVSVSALFVAKAARYDEPSMKRGLVGEWQPFLSRYFVKDGRHWVVSDIVRRRVRFSGHNLFDDATKFGRFHLIFLRNVAIYFAEDARRTLIERLADSLAMNGVLCLGTSESLRGVTDRFTPIADCPGYYRVSR